MASNQSTLEDSVASILTIAENTIMPAIIEEYFSDFLSSADYVAFTKAPEGNKAYKNLKGKVHKARGIRKESHQEFSFEHLTNDDGRRKYGKKMLDTLQANRKLGDQEYSSYLPETRRRPVDSRSRGTLVHRLANHFGGHEECDDKLEALLAEYYLFPSIGYNCVMEESVDDSTRVVTGYTFETDLYPTSGYEIFHNYLVTKGPRATKVASFLEAICFFRALREFQGNAPAMQFLYTKFIPFYITDEQLDIYNEYDDHPGGYVTTTLKTKVWEELKGIKAEHRAIRDVRSDKDDDSVFNLAVSLSTKVKLDSNHHSKREVYWC